MTAETLWQKFIETGRPLDYLGFVRQRREEEKMTVEIHDRRACDKRDEYR